MDPLFQVLVQNSSDAVAMLDADGTIRFLSDSAARLLGYSLGERITRSARADAPRRRAAGARLVRGMPAASGRAAGGRVPPAPQGRIVAQPRRHRGEPPRP